MICEAKIALGFPVVGIDGEWCVLYEARLSENVWEQGLHFLCGWMGSLWSSLIVCVCVFSYDKGLNMTDDGCMLVFIFSIHVLYFFCTI